MNAKVLLVFFVVGLYGCTHPLDIVGEGDILSSSGDNDCLLENLPCEAIAGGDYLETYTAVARPGHEFVGWEGCISSDNTLCSFDVPEDIVVQFWFETAPPLVAKFAPECSQAPADSFAAIGDVIFTGKGCSAGGCHSGSAPQAGMNLSSNVAYGNIVNVNSRTSSLQRVLPGDASSSYLFRKVSAKTNPGSFPISGSPMPRNNRVLSNDELAALELWINAGAPQFGRADEFKQVEQLLGLCD
jgi:hypothetical protein